MQPVYDAGIKVYNNRGNHDCPNYPNCIDAWNNAFSGPYALPDNGPAGEVNLTYSVTHKNVIVLALDELKTPNHSENYVHQAWVDDVLAANTKPHIFAFGHYTAFKMMWDSLGDHPATRDLFWESLENAGGRTYFCGHEHFFDRASADDDGDPNNDLYQYVIGSAGAPEHNWKGDWIGDNSDMVLKSIYHTVRFGYVIVDINGPDATLTWMERHTNEPNIPGIYQPMDILSYTVVCGDTDHPYPLGDIDKDCYVNYFDLAIIGNQWELPPDVRSADIAPEVPDGVVNRLDLAVFAAHWLEYLDP
jgi:hypothetical protein